MKKAGSLEHRGKPQSPPPQPAHPAPAILPMRARPALFYGLLAGVGAWVVCLLALYFVTVYPNRETPAEPSPAEPPPPPGQTVPQ